MLNEIERGAAAAVRRALSREVEAIRADDRLSADGKRGAIARATLSARADMRTLRQGADAREEQERHEAQYRLFGVGTRGVGTDLLAARDAHDRAERITSPAEAAQLLDRAERTGDISLGRAVFARVFDMSIGGGELSGQWGTLGAAYLDKHPEAREDADLLAALASPSVEDRGRDRLATELMLPDEVRTGQLEAIAADWDSGDAA